MTATPVRDLLIFVVEALMDECDDLADHCIDCIRASCGWCDKHLELQARYDELEPVSLNLWMAGTDDEAWAAVAGLPHVTALLPATPGITPHDQHDQAKKAA